MQSAKSAGFLRVLSISPIEEDHLSLGAIVRHSRWMMFKADHLVGALGFLRQHDISVILCERDLAPGKWTDILEYANDLSHPPSLIVTSRQADERLWAEALNLGAWDVLAKPFDRTEVLRSVTAAWQHWYGQMQAPGRATNQLRAAS